MALRFFRKISQAASTHTVRVLLGMLGIALAPLPNAVVAAEDDFLLYFDNCPLSLGSGLSLANPAAVKEPALTFQTKRPHGGIPATIVFAHVVTSNEELLSDLGIEVRMQFRSLLAHASATAGFSRADRRQNRSYSLVLSAKTDYGLLEMDAEPTLTENAKTLLAENRDAFERKYGTHYVAKVQKGSSAHSVLTLTVSDADANEMFGADVAGGGGVPLLAGDARAKFSSRVSTAAQKGALDINVRITGGEGEKELKQLISAFTLVGGPEMLQKIQDALANAIQNHNFENSASIGFHVAPMSNLTGAEPRSLWDERAEGHLRLLVERYDHATKVLEMARRHLADDGAVPPERRILTADERRQLGQVIDAYDSYQIALADAHRELLNGNTRQTIPAEPTIKVGNEQVHVGDLKAFWKIVRGPTALETIDAIATRLGTVEGRLESLRDSVKFGVGHSHDYGHPLNTGLRADEWHVGIVGCRGVDGEVEQDAVGPLIRIEPFVSDGNWFVRCDFITSEPHHEKWDIMWIAVRRNVLTNSEFKLPW
jgi:hypothetical protein